MTASMSAKLMSLRQAIEESVSDGDSVYLAGFTHLIPYAAAHEIIRQGKKELTLCRATPELIYDQMVAAGCARKLVFSWAGNPGVGMLRAIRRAVEASELEIEEYSHFAMVSRLFAGAAGLPFMSVRSGAGSDLPLHNQRIKSLQCPYSGVEVKVVPPLNPDVAVIHVQRADIDGNAHIWGVVGEQKEVAFAARKVILTAEEIVDHEVIRSDPSRTIIPGMVVQAVVELPWCAHPSYAQGYYDRDNAFYQQWDSISKSESSLRSYLDEWVYGVEDRREYLERLGAEKLLELTPRPHYAVPVNYGIY